MGREEGGGREWDDKEMGIEGGVWCFSGSFYCYPVRDKRVWRDVPSIK